MDERDDINKYREKVKRRKSTIKFIVFVVITAALVIVIINWKSILAPFKDIGSKNGEGGFPVNITGSASYRLGKMGECFCLLTDTYLYTYNEDGAELLDAQHGFQNPVFAANSKRALVYDMGGKDVKLYSRNSELFSRSFEDSIVFAVMGTDERSAVITTSSRYSNYLYVLNSEGKQIFRWASPEEKIVQAVFGSDDKSIFVSVVGEEDGTLYSSVLRFELDDNAESETWRTAIGNNVSYSLERCKDGVYAVTPSGAFLLNETTGEQIASNTYTREIFGIPSSDGIRVTLFHDPVSNGEVANAYSEALETSAAMSLDNTSAFDVADGRLYILSGNKLTSYDTGLQTVNTYELDEEYSDVKIIGKYAYLLGYNLVWRQEL